MHIACPHLRGERGIAVMVRTFTYLLLVALHTPAAPTVVAELAEGLARAHHHARVHGELTEEEGEAEDPS